MCDVVLLILYQCIYIYLFIHSYVYIYLSVLGRHLSILIVWFHFSPAPPPPPLPPPPLRPNKAGAAPFVFNKILESERMREKCIFLKEASHYATPPAFRALRVQSGCCHAGVALPPRNIIASSSALRHKRQPGKTSRQDQAQKKRSL